jgi:hypothetical protein
LGENGSIFSAADVPDGTAFLDLGSSPGPVEFIFPANVNSVGALVSADSGSIILSVFSDSGALLQRVSVPAVHVAAWPSNFIGVESSIGIRRASFTNSNFLKGFNVLVLDDLIFETVPEPNYMRFLLVLASFGAWVCMRRPKL